MAEPGGQKKERRRIKAPESAEAAAKKKSAGRANKGEVNVEADPVSALDHVLRREILRLLHGFDGPRSPVWAAEKLDHPLSDVSYHFRALLKLKAIALDKQTPVRGAVEHFYISKVADDPVILGVLERTREADGHLMRRR
jgi:hypothetical protein